MGGGRGGGCNQPGSGVMVTRPGPAHAPPALACLAPPLNDPPPPPPQPHPNVGFDAQKFPPPPE